MKLGVYQLCKEALFWASDFEWLQLADLFADAGVLAIDRVELPSLPSDPPLPIENIVVRDRAEGLIEIWTEESSLVIEGPKPLREILGQVAREMPSAPADPGMHVHIDYCIMPKCISETSLFMIWQRLTESPAK